MKRIIIALTLILSLTICLVGCNGGGTTTTPSSAETDPVLKQMNDLFDKDFVRYQIGIDTINPNGEKLTTLYSVSNMGMVRVINYSIDKLNEIEIENGVITLPTEYKTTHTGTLDAVTSANDEYDLPSFNFSKECFSTYSLKDNKFTAIVTSTELFMGENLGVNYANLTVEFGDESGIVLSLSYKTYYGNTVTLYYVI